MQIRFHSFKYSIKQIKSNQLSMIWNLRGSAPLLESSWLQSPITTSALYCISILTLSAEILELDPERGDFVEWVRRFNKIIQDIIDYIIIIIRRRIIIYRGYGSKNNHNHLIAFLLYERGDCSVFYFLPVDGILIHLL